jgi:PKD repeat protein
MPYQANDNVPCSDKCEDWDTYHSPPEADDILWQLEDWGANHNFNNLDPNDRDIVKSWLMDKGPLSVSMYASSSFSSYWDSHHSQNDFYYEGNHGSTNHAVVLVGWVDDPEVTNGGYWIVKNSWGIAWGYGGYFNAAYGGQDIGRIVRWCKTFNRPQRQSGPGPIDYDLAVFSNYDYHTYDGSVYPHPGDQIKFSDISEGDVALREWDFDGDGVVDSNQKNPTHIYFDEGEYIVTLTVTNQWGLSSNRTKTVKVLEFWPPKAVVNYNVFILHGTLVCSDFDARYSYDRDGGSITGYHWDFGDGSTAEGSTPDHVFPQGDRIYNVTLTVTDNDGVSESAVCQVKIDNTVPPETKIFHRGYFELEDWYSKSQYIYFISSDWTSVSDTYYRVDDGVWYKYEPSKLEFIPVVSEGEHKVEVYSVDYWGNEETVVSEMFSIDKTEPTLEVVITDGDLVDGWYTGPVTVEFSGDDALSGLYKIMYRLDYAAWQDYEDPIVIEDEGIHYLCVFAVDNAGNSNEQCVKQVKVDLGDPLTTCRFYGDGSDNRFYKNVEVRLLYSDEGSGVKNTFYNLDDEGFRTYYQPFIVDILGDHIIEFYSEDNIGNKEPVKTETFMVSKLNFDMGITSPAEGLYLFGFRLLPLQKTILIGTGEIYVTVESFTSEAANIDHVDFLLDGVVQETVSVWPYSWTIEGKITGTHSIEAVAFTDNYESVSDDITAILLII